MKAARARLGVVGGLALAACLTTGCQPKGADGSPSAQPAASALRGQAAQRWADGELVVFALDLGSKVQLNGTTETGLALGLKGTLNLSAHSPAPGTVNLMATLQQPQLELTGSSGPVSAAQLQAELARPAVIRLASGKLEDLRVDKQASPLTISLWQTIAAALQLTPGKPDATRWQARETDATGAYTVEYALLGPSELAKKKVEYEKTPVKEARFGLSFDLVPKVLASSTKIHLDGSRIQSVELDEQLELQVGAASPSRSENHVTLRQLRHSAAPAVDEAALWAATSPIAELQRRQVPQSFSNERDAERARHTTFAKTLSLLERQERDPSRKRLIGSDNGVAIDETERLRREQQVKDRAEAFTDMVALLRTAPANVALAFAAVARGSSAASRVQDALASAGTPDCQAGLVRIAQDDKLPNNARLSAATSLIRVVQPTEPTLDALLSAINDDLLATHALYGLGTMARHFRDGGDAAHAERLSKALVQYLEASTTDSQRVRALRAIANSGFAGALPNVKALLDAPARDVRGAALEALRHMDHPEIDGILAAHLASDTDAEVRLSALNAFKTRPPSEVLARALIAAAADPQPRVRNTAAKLMRAWKDSRPELAEPLAALAAKDSVNWVAESAEPSTEP